MYCADCPYCGALFKDSEYERVKQELRDHIYETHHQEFLKDHPKLVEVAPKNIPSPEKWAIGYFSAYRVREC